MPYINIQDAYQDADRVINELRISFDGIYHKLCRQYVREIGQLFRQLDNIYSQAQEIILLPISNEQDSMSFDKNNLELLSLMKRQYNSIYNNLIFISLCGLLSNFHYVLKSDITGMIGAIKKFAGVLGELGAVTCAQAHNLLADIYIIESIFVDSDSDFDLYMEIAKSELAMGLFNSGYTKQELHLLLLQMKLINREQRALSCIGIRAVCSIDIYQSALQDSIQKQEQLIAIVADTVFVITDRNAISLFNLHYQLTVLAYLNQHSRMVLLSQHFNLPGINELTDLGESLELTACSKLISFTHEHAKSEYFIGVMKNLAIVAEYKTTPVDINTLVNNMSQHVYSYLSNNVDNIEETRQALSIVCPLMLLIFNKFFSITMENSDTAQKFQTIRLWFNLICSRQYLLDYISADIAVKEAVLSQVNQALDFLSEYPIRYSDYMNHVELSGNLAMLYVRQQFNMDRELLVKLYRRIATAYSIDDITKHLGDYRKNYQTLCTLDFVIGLYEATIFLHSVDEAREEIIEQIRIQSNVKQHLHLLVSSQILEISAIASINMKNRLLDNAYEHLELSNSFAKFLMSYHYHRSRMYSSNILGSIRQLCFATSIDDTYTNFFDYLKHIQDCKLLLDELYEACVVMLGNEPHSVEFKNELHLADINTEVFTSHIASLKSKFFQPAPQSLSAPLEFITDQNSASVSSHMPLLQKKQSSKILPCKRKADDTGEDTHLSKRECNYDNNPYAEPNNYSC